jgi:sugar phosphate permease
MKEQRIAAEQKRPLGTASHVRYSVLAFASALAVVTYVQRLGFSAGAPEIGDSLHLDANRIADLGAIWLVAYGLFQVPGGLLGDRWGPRHVLTSMVLVWSALTAAVGLAALLPPVLGLPFLFLLAVRFLFGGVQAGGFPVIGRIMADWMPLSERGFAQGCIWTLSRFGGFVIPLVLPFLFARFGDWPVPFVLLGVLGGVWCLAFWPWFRNRPEEMPQVNPGERALIEAGRPAVKDQPRAVPWSRMLGSVTFWSLCLMYGFTGFSGNFFTSGLLPLYLDKHRHLEADQRAWLTGLPLAGGAVACLLGGYASDLLIRRSGNRKWGRRAAGMIGLSLAGLALLSTIWVQNVWLLGLLLTLSFFGNDLTMGPAWASCADVGERYTGSVSGAMNMIGAFFGAAGTKLAGHLFQLDRVTHEGQARWVFILFAGVYGLAALCWLGVDVTRRLADTPGTS